MNEDDAVEALLTAHADMARLTVELAEARERRRTAARQLVELGRGTSWLAARLGVTPQAVDGFLKYKERAGRLLAAAWLLSRRVGVRIRPEAI